VTHPYEKYKGLTREQMQEASRKPGSLKKLMERISAGESVTPGVLIQPIQRKDDGQEEKS
jgi:hypothetical protein